MRDLSLDYFVLSETKLDDSFPSAQFSINEYEIRARRDRMCRRGFICKSKNELEPKQSECLCSELTLSKKKWLIFSIYRPPDYGNLSMFFHELSFSLDKASEIYENIIIMGDFNIDVTTKGMGFDKLDEFCDIFNLTNLITSDTCITKTSSSLIDLYLTNKPLSFQKSQVTKTGLSDFHKLVTVFLSVVILDLSQKL